MGEHCYDGLTFIPNRDIIVLGMGLFQRHPNNGPQAFNLAYKFEIRDENDNELTESELKIEEVHPVSQEIDNYTF